MWSAMCSALLVLTILVDVAPLWEGVLEFPLAAATVNILCNSWIRQISFEPGSSPVSGALRVRR